MGLGLKGLTFGEDNFEEIFKKCLKHGSYKSLAVILDKYKSSNLISVDFVEFLFSALATKQTPDFIIFKLFNFMVETH